MKLPHRLQCIYQGKKNKKNLLLHLAMGGYITPGTFSADLIDGSRGSLWCVCVRACERAAARALPPQPTSQSLHCPLRQLCVVCRGGLTGSLCVSAGCQLQFKPRRHLRRPFPSDCLQPTDSHVENQCGRVQRQKKSRSPRPPPTPHRQPPSQFLLRRICFSPSVHCQAVTPCQHVGRNTA